MEAGMDTSALDTLEDIWYNGSVRTWYDER